MLVSSRKAALDAAARCRANSSVSHEPSPLTYVRSCVQRNPAALPAEVQAFMKGNAVPGQITGALPNSGDPNLLLQVGK